MSIQVEMVTEALQLWLIKPSGYNVSCWISRLVSSAKKKWRCQGCIDLKQAQSCIKTIPTRNHMFKVNNRNTRTRYEICTKLIIKTPQRHHGHQFLGAKLHFVYDFMWLTQLAILSSTCTTQVYNTTSSN